MARDLKQYRDIFYQAIKYHPIAGKHPQAVLNAIEAGLEAVQQQMQEEGFDPDWAISPGEYLREVLDSRGMDYEEAADATRMTPFIVQQLASGARDLELPDAIALEKGLGIDAQIWLRMEADWQLHRARQVLGEKYA